MYLRSKFATKAALGLLALSLSAPVFANGSYSQPSNDGFYAGVHGGVGFYNGDLKDYTKTGFDGGAQLGYAFNPLRVELEATYYRNGIKGLPSSDHLNLWVLMGNVYYDFKTGTPWTPYVGAGLGVLHPTVTDSTNTISGDDEFAYQGIAGVDYRLSQQWSVGADYHLLGWKNNGGDYHHAFNAVLTYHFG